MTTTNVITREPSKSDYASPIQFRFKCTKLPLVEFFVQSANIPGINLGSATQTNPLYDIPLPGDKITYSALDMSFLVDENLNNYKEIHDWIIGLGFPSNNQQFQDLQDNHRFFHLYSSHYKNLSKQEHHRLILANIQLSQDALSDTNVDHNQQYNHYILPIWRAHQRN